ncbi:MAG: hypothetical protein ACQETQ_13280 [Spirochaetota bacterium]
MPRLHPWGHISPIEAYLAEDLRERAQEVAGSLPRDVVSRAAEFRLLKDSKASYTIEGEEPP